MSVVKDFLNSSRKDESPVKKFLSQPLDLTYNTVYANPAEVGPPAPEDNSVGAVEAGLREGAAYLEGSRGFLEQLAATPANLFELGSATLEGREPQYDQPQVTAQQRAAAWRDTGTRERGLAAEIGAGVGGALGMFPEMLATGGIGATGQAGNLASQSLRQFLASQADEAARASAFMAPRAGAQTSMEAEQAGATLPSALAAGAVETAITPLTNMIPVSAAGRLGSRLATGAVGGAAAEAGVQGAVTPFLPDELAAQRDLTNPQNLTTAAGLGALMGAAFGTRAPTRAQRVEQQRLSEIAKQDTSGQVAEGLAAAQAIEASARGESTTVPDLSTPRGPSSPFLPRDEGVDLNTPIGETSALLNPITENLNTPRGPVSLLPGSDPVTSLGLDTPRGDSTPLSESPVLKARVEALTQQRDTILQKSPPLSRKDKSRVKTLNKEITSLSPPVPTGPIDRLARTQPPSLSNEASAPPATTPQPTTRAQRTEAARTAPVDMRASDPPSVVGPTVREDVIDPETGAVTGEQTAEPGVPITDNDRLKLEEYFTASKANRSVDMAGLRELANRTLNVTTPPEQRQATPLRQALGRAKTAWDALAGVKAAVKMGADPKIERYDRLIDSLATPDMKNVDFTVLQPETEARTPTQQRIKDGNPQEMYTKGVHEIDPNTGRESVTVVGDGYARKDGTAQVETTLHEIVHAKTAKTIRAVRAGTEVNPEIVRSVNELDSTRTNLRKNAPEKGLTPDEKEAMKYATENLDEFLSGVMTNPLVQSSLKKENLWDKIRNMVRAILRIPRSQKALLDEVLDASYALVDLINKREEKAPEVAGGRESTLRSATPTKPSNSRVIEAKELAIGRRTKLSPMPRTDLSRALNKAWRGLHFMFSANKRGTDETTEAFSKAQGAIQRAHAELQPIGLKLDRLISGLSRRTGGARAELSTKYLSTNKPDEKAAIAKKLADPELVKTLDSARAVMDRVSTEVGGELVKAYEGRPMPESMLDLLTTIKENMGQYTARVYMNDLESGYASRLWESYKKGDKQALAQLQPLVDKVDGMLNGLESWIEGAKQEAKALSDPRVEFDAVDTLLGKEIKNLYSNFLGNPGNKPLRELFKELEDFSALIKDSDIIKERDRAVQKIIGVFDDAASTDALVAYSRAMRSNEKATLRRQSVPPEIRRAWGEVVDPILVFNITTARAAAAMANLRSSNYLVDNAPQLFSTRENPDTNQMARIPNNPVAYGKMAGMYTTPEVHDAVVAQMATLGAKGIGNDAAGWLAQGFQFGLNVGRKVTKWTKLSQIVFNVFNGTVLNSLNTVYMPLINGNLNPARAKDAFMAAQALVATAYREGKPDARALELLEQGVIDPVQLQVDEEVRARTKEARAIEQGGVLQTTGAKKVFDQFWTNPANTVKEVVNFFELLPKVWNYYNAKDEFKKAFPDLSEKELRDMAAEQTNQMNPTYARTRMAVMSTETALVSYTANYMEQIASNTAMAIKVGYTQATNGIKTGNKQLAYMGIKKLMGVTTAMALSYQLPSVLASALGTEEDDEDKIIADNLPFMDRGMQPVIIGVDGDRVTYMDAGRANPGDTVHAPLRAFISAIANIASDNTEEASRDLEGGISNLKGQFFGGSLLGGIVLAMAGGRRTGSQLEKDSPELYTWIAENAPAPSFSTNISNATYTALVPAQAKGLVEAYSRKQKQGDDFEWDTREVLTALRAPVRDVSMIDSVRAAANDLRMAKETPSTNLQTVVLAPGEVSRERLQELVDDLVDSQQEPYNEMLRSLEGIRAVGRRQGMDNSQINTMLQDSLKAGNIGEADRRAILRGEAFKPKPLSPRYLEDAISNRIRRENVRSERSRLEATYKGRVALVRQLMAERIRSYQETTN